jgi:hypothetical protein
LDYHAELLLVSTWKELKGRKKLLLHLFSCACLEWKVSMLHFFSFPSSLPHHLHCFSSSLSLMLPLSLVSFSLTFVFLVPAPFFGLFGSLEDGAWTGTKAKGHGVATSFEAQTDFNVLQEGLDANYPETCDSSCAYLPSNNKINQSRFEKLKKSPQSDHWVATLLPSPHWGSGSRARPQLPRWVAVAAALGRTPCTTPGHGRRRAGSCHPGPSNDAAPRGRRRLIEEMVVQDAYEAGGGADEAGVGADEACGGGWEMT